MHLEHTRWGRVNVEGTSVVELEHMFGFDVIWYETSQDGHARPIRMITAARAMSKQERQKAVMAATWRDSERFDIWNTHVMDLAESLEV